MIMITYWSTEEWSHVIRSAGQSINWSIGLRQGHSRTWWTDASINQSARQPIIESINLSVNWPNDRKWHLGNRWINQSINQQVHLSNNHSWISSFHPFNQSINQWIVKSIVDLCHQFNWSIDALINQSEAWIVMTFLVDGSTKQSIINQPSLGDSYPIINQSINISIDQFTITSINWAIILSIDQSIDKIWNYDMHLKHSFHPSD